MGPTTLEGAVHLGKGASHLPPVRLESRPLCAPPDDLGRRSRVRGAVLVRRVVVSQRLDHGRVLLDSHGSPRPGVERRSVLAVQFNGLVRGGKPNGGGQHEALPVVGDVAAGAVQHDGQVEQLRGRTLLRLVQALPDEEERLVLAARLGDRQRRLHGQRGWHEGAGAPVGPGAIFQQLRQLGLGLQYHLNVRFDDRHAAKGVHATRKLKGGHRPQAVAVG